MKDKSLLYSVRTNTSDLNQTRVEIIADASANSATTNEISYTILNLVWYPIYDSVDASAYSAIHYFVRDTSWRITKIKHDN